MLNSRDLIIHIGMHKTGSTALQVAAAYQRARLAQAGLSYPSAGVPRSDPYGQHAIAWQVVGDARHDGGDHLATVAEEIERDPQPRSLLSSEDLCLLTTDDQIKRLLGAFPTHRPLVVLYLRRQDDFLAALYTTAVLHYGESRMIEALLDHPQCDYLGLARLWCRHVGRERLRIYRYGPGSPAGHDIVAHARSEWLPELGPDFATDRANHSPPPVIVRLAAYLNRIGAAPSVLASLRQVGGRLGPVIPGDVLLSFAQRQALMDRWRPSNDTLAQEFLDGLPMFPDPVPDNVPVQAGPGAEWGLIMAYIAASLDRRPASDTNGNIRHQAGTATGDPGRE